LIKSRQISSSELLKHYLERVDQYNGPINAVIAQNRDGTTSSPRPSGTTRT
jgi:Asp-tRNA(Asn)/Glu-tRNA(Gln) amidotransferase A subunit family amidase